MDSGSEASMESGNIEDTLPDGFLEQLYSNNHGCNGNSEASASDCKSGSSANGIQCISSVCGEENIPTLDKRTINHAEISDGHHTQHPPKISVGSPRTPLRPLIAQFRHGNNDVPPSSGPIILTLVTQPDPDSSKTKPAQEHSVSADPKIQEIVPMLGAPVKASTIASAHIVASTSATQDVERCPRSSFASGVANKADYPSADQADASEHSVPQHLSTNVEPHNNSSTSPNGVDEVTYHDADQAPATSEEPSPTQPSTRRSPLSGPSLIGPQASKFSPSDAFIPTTCGVSMRPAFTANQQLWTRRDGDREQLTRMQALLLKTRQDLASERLTNQTMRTAMESQLQRDVGAGLENMLVDLLAKQTEVARQTELLQERELDLQRRAQQAHQLEIFLAKGQRQLYHDIEAQCGRPASVIELDHAARQAELVAFAKVRSLEARIEAQQQQLNIREAGLEFRERCYQTSVRDALKAELRATLETDIEARISAAEYERGFCAGRKVGHAEGKENIHQTGFLAGYVACRRTLDVLEKFRAGRIAYNSPELDFLTNPEHPENPFNRGLQIGRLGLSMSVEGSVRTSVPQVLTLKPSGTKTQQNGFEAATSDSTYPSDVTFKTNSATAPAVHPPPKQNFANYHGGKPSEARHASATSAHPKRNASMSNGALHHTNGYTTNGKSLYVNDKFIRLATNGNNVYSGRRIHRYKDSDEDAVTREPTPAAEKFHGRVVNESVSAQEQADLIDLTPDLY